MHIAKVLRYRNFLWPVWLLLHALRCMCVAVVLLCSSLWALLVILVTAVAIVEQAQAADSACCYGAELLPAKPQCRLSMSH